MISLRACMVSLVFTLHFVQFARAAILVDDTWADGTRTNQNLPTESAWYANNTANLTNAPGGGSMTGVVPSGSTMWVTYFTAAGSPSTLSVGETLKVTMVFTPTNVTAATGTTRGFRVGLYNFSDGGTRAGADGFSTSGLGQNVKGYMLNMNFAQAFTTSPLQIQERTLVTDAALMSASGDYTTLPSGTGGGVAGDPGFTNGTQYTLEFSATRTADDEVVITNRFFGPNLDISHFAYDSVGANFAFDAFAIRPAGAASSAETFTITQFKVEGPGGTLTAPAIVTEPQDLTRTVGQFASFTVSASGSAPLRYQWFFNTNTPIANATNATLNLTNVQLSDAGGYSVRVTNNLAAATSQVATLTVNLPVFTTTGLVVNDTWDDGDRLFGPVTLSNATWYASGGLTAAVGSMTGLADPATSRLWVGYFTEDPNTPVDLAVGKALKATLVFTPSMVATQNDNTFRIGLFNYADGGTRLSTDGFSGSAGNGTNVTGYMLTINFGELFGDDSPLEFYARTNMADNNLLGTTGDYTSLGSGPANSDNAPAFQNNTEYNLELLVTRASPTLINLQARIVGGSLNIQHSTTDSSFLYRRFDAFGLRPNRSWDSAEQFTFSRFTVEVVEPTIPFSITSVTRLSADEVKLTWASVSNRVYQVQSKDSLNAATWTTNATVTAISDSTAYTNSGVSSVTQRLYRVVQTP